MELTTTAYNPISNELNPIEVGRISLYNKEILSLNTETESSWARDFNINNITQRLSYNIEFLDKYHKDIPSPQNYVKIIFKDFDEKEKSVYIRTNPLERFQLKWVFERTFIQKNYKFWIPIVISLIAATFTFVEMKSNNAIENKLIKIDSLDSTLKFSLEEIRVLQQEAFNIKDSLLSKEDTLHNKNQLDK